MPIISQDWSSYVELGTESWKRFGTLTARRQVGLRFLWNVVSLDPSAISVRLSVDEMINPAC